MTSPAPLPGGEHIPTSREPKTWRELADEQDGVLARWQALQAGLSPAAWTWRLAHDWQTALPGVAVLHTGAITDHECRWAAALRFRDGGRLDGDAALLEHGLKRLDVDRLDVLHHGRANLAPLTTSTGLVVRPRRLGVRPEWTTTRGGMPVTVVHVATLHAAAWAASDRAAELRMVMAVQQRLTNVPRLRAAAEQMSRLPRRRLITTVLDDIELGAHALIEVDFVRFCRACGLPLPDRLQVVVRANGKRYLDARWDRQKVSLELDGVQHLWAENWSTDTLRSLELAASGAPGERMIRLTGFNLRHDGDRVAELLRQILT